MKYCIYLKKKVPEVSFSSEEHIFPAGIGGIQKLPMEYVSHECNNAFSAMELSFMRNSLIALPRQFYGPGKRGNLNPKNATKSKVSLIDGESNPNEIKFGYISLGKPYLISQIKVNIKGNYHFLSDTSLGDEVKQVSGFLKKLGKYNGKHTLYQDERLTQDEFILGVHDGKWYLALNHKQHEPQIKNFIMNSLENTLENQTARKGTEQVKVFQTIEFDETFYRVCAKIIFNYLAFVKGQDFVLKECFNPIRHWIVNGGENNFVTLSGQKINMPISYPEKAHKLFIIQDRNSLRGLISFYGDHFETLINLCDDFDGVLGLDGFICDWQNRQELRLIDYISNYTSH